MSLTLAGALAAASAALGPLERAETAEGGVEYRRDGRPFALVAAGGRAASFHLAPSVADAALRTPDTTRSERGRGWVTLAPTALDDPTLDRATAWLASAWRTAGRP